MRGMTHIVAKQGFESELLHVFRHGWMRLKTTTVKIPTWESADVWVHAILRIEHADGSIAVFVEYREEPNEEGLGETEYISSFAENTRW